MPYAGAYHAGDVLFGFGLELGRLGCSGIALLLWLVQKGEVLKAEWRDFLTPQDLLSDDNRFFVCIREAKSRGRVPGVQHVTATF